MYIDTSHISSMAVQVNAGMQTTPLNTCSISKEHVNIINNDECKMLEPLCINPPLQAYPDTVYPALQLHWNDPGVLVHI